MRWPNHPEGRAGPIRTRQRGASAVEFLFAAGLITLLGTVVLQYVLLFNAKNMVGHASFMAARAGSMHHAQLPDIQDAYARAIAANTRIELLNSTHEIFDEWADAALAIEYEGRRTIRNANQGQTGSVKSVTRAINGGENGLVDRRKRYNAVACLLGLDQEE